MKDLDIILLVIFIVVTVIVGIAIFKPNVFFRSGGLYMGGIGDEKNHEVDIKYSVAPNRCNALLDKLNSELISYNNICNQYIIADERGANDDVKKLLEEKRQKKNIVDGIKTELKSVGCFYEDDNPDNINYQIYLNSIKNSVEPDRCNYLLNSFIHALKAYNNASGIYIAKSQNSTKEEKQKLIKTMENAKLQVIRLQDDMKSVGCIY